MSGKPRASYGRTATLIVLAVLVLTVSASVYLSMAKYELDRAPPAETIDYDAELARLKHETLVLTILLISALLILLFVVGAYLLIRVGRMVARNPVGGKPTPYVDVWQSYRLTDEEIAAATREEPPGGDAGRRPASPGEPPPGPRPPSPPVEE